LRLKQVLVVKGQLLATYLATFNSRPLTRKLPKRRERAVSLANV
jgi:hypothetical protein